MLMLYAPVIDDETFSYRQVNVEQQMAEPTPLWHTLHRMLMLRKQYRAFGRQLLVHAAG